MVPLRRIYRVSDVLRGCSWMPRIDVDSKHFLRLEVLNYTMNEV